jgi:hypothetical protein
MLGAEHDRLAVSQPAQHDARAVGAACHVRAEAATRGYRHVVEHLVGHRLVKRAALAVQRVIDEY